MLRVPRERFSVHSSQYFSCVALMPDVDSEVSLGSSDEAARLVSNGRQVTVSLDLGFPAQLVNSDARDNTSFSWGVRGPGLQTRGEV